MTWVNETKTIEAWTLDDETLIIKSKINKPMDGFDHYFLVDCLSIQRQEQTPERLG